MNNIKRFSSRKEVTEFLKEKEIDTSNWSEEKWLSLNKGQAEIHMMELAECIYDEYQNSVPTQLKENEWHIPMRNKIDNDILLDTLEDGNFPNDKIENYLVKISTAMAAHTSYTIVGGEAVKSYEKWIELHDKLVAYDPPHSSPMEHCARAMSDDEYYSYVKGTVDAKIDADGFINIEGHTNLNVFGWCNNLKGFISYRYMIDNKWKS